MEVWVVARHCHTAKDFVQCIFCLKILPSGIKRFQTAPCRQVWWHYEWVQQTDEADGDNSLWGAVDGALGASQGLWGRNFPRDDVVGVGSSFQPQRT